MFSTREMLRLFHGHGNANVSNNEVQFFPPLPRSAKMKKNQQSAAAGEILNQSGVFIHYWSEGELLQLSRK